MSTLPPAFLSPVQLTRSRHRLPSHVSSSTCAKSRTSRRPSYSVHRRTLCVAQEEKVHSPTPQVPSEETGAEIPQAAAAARSTELDEAERKEKARKARMEAERLELMAAKARLECERAELQAERKRLELDKVRSMKEIQESRDEILEKSNNNSTTQDASTNLSKEKNDELKDEVKDSKASATVKIGPGPTRQVTAESLSDLLSSEFPRVSESDITIIKEKLCGMDTFFATEVDRSPFDERVVFRGNMRMEATPLLEEIEKRAEKEGVAERVRFFILVDPKEIPNEGDGERRPVLVALPSAAMPTQTSPFSIVFSTAVGCIALFTSFSYGIGTFGLTPEVITQIAKGSSQEALLTLPISIGIMVLSVLHDLGHRVMGQLRDVKLGLPFFIPSLQIGNFGIITPLESYARFRKDLFDVAVAGPVVGLTASLGALLYGLIMTSGGDATSWFPQVPSALFHASLVVGTLSDIILPAAMRAQTTFPVHPLCVVGYTGLIINALNLMPIGRLDGGRIVQALYGRVVAGRATAITLLVQALGSIAGNSPLLLFWGLVCVILQRESDYPCLNEVEEPDNSRTVFGLSMLVIALLVLIPFPDQAGNILGSL